MIIKSLQLTHFRCFRSLELEFHPTLTVLIAENGSGKTTVLDGIAIALDEIVRYHADKKSNSPWRSVLHRKDVRLGKESATVAAAVLADREFTFEWSDSIEIQGPDKTQHSSGKRPEQLLQYLDRNWRGETLDDAPLVVFYRAHRAFRDLADSGKFRLKAFEPKNAFESALDASAGSDAIQHWYYQIENEEAREKANRRDFDYQDPRLRSVREAVKTMIPQALGMGFEPGTTGLSIFWDQPGDDSDDPIEGFPGTLFLDQLSDGYRTLLSVVMDLAVRLVIANPDRDNPLHAQCVVMIDEIDLHLHPRLQQTVIPSLQKTFPNAQFIVSTHSAEAVTTAKQENIRILSCGKVRQCPSPTYGAKASDVVRDVMGLPGLRPENEIGTAFAELFEALEASDPDRARELLEIVKAWDPGRNDSDITRAELILRRIEKLKPS